MVKGKIMFTVGDTTLSMAELLAIEPDEHNYRTVACGARIQIGNNAWISDNVQICNEARIGNCAWIGDFARIDDSAQIGNCAWIGDFAWIGDSAQIGNSARIGNSAWVEDCARGVLADLGCEQGRGHARLAYWDRDGKPRITAGCRDFSLTEARAHWGSPNYPDADRGREYLALCDYVETLATLRVGLDKEEN